MERVSPAFVLHAENRRRSCWDDDDDDNDDDDDDDDDGDDNAVVLFMNVRESSMPFPPSPFGPPRYSSRPSFLIAETVNASHRLQVLPTMRLPTMPVK